MKVLSEPSGYEAHMGRIYFLIVENYHLMGIEGCKYFFLAN